MAGTRLRVSKPSGSGFAVHWTALLGDKLGLYADEGLDVDIVALSQADGTQALLSGDVPIMRRGPDESVALIGAGADISIVSGLIRRPPIYLYAARDIGRIADLRGRTIAGISARFGSSLNLRLLLEDEGLAPADYVIEHVGGSYDRFAALRSGRAAAALLSPPTNDDAARAGFALLANVPERYPAFMFSAIQANNRFAQRNADAVVAYLRAEVRAQAALRDPARTKDCIALLAEADGIPIEAARSVYETMVVRDGVFTEKGEIEGPALEILVETLKRFGEVRPEMRSSDCFDDQYLVEAQAQLAV